MSKKFPHPFSDLAKKYREMRSKLPAEVSGIAVIEFKGHFRAQGYYGSGGALVPWKKRAKEERPARALLIKSGRLRRGLRAAPTGDTARVINDVPYAAIHNEGGKINTTATVRAHNRKNGQKVKAHKRKVNLNIPARPYMLDTPRLMKQIDKHLETRIESIFNSAQNA